MRASVLAVLLFCTAGSGKPLDDAVLALPGFDPSHVSSPCSDGEYLRRLSLDLLGYPPSGVEAAAFIADPAPDKRTRKLEEALSNPRFAEYWARRYAEVFFGNYHEPTFDLPDGLPVEIRRTLLKNFIAWLREQIQADRPWPEIMTAMLVARGNSATTPELGYKLSFYGTEPQEVKFVDGVSRHFMGLNLRCASCHDHPYCSSRPEDFFGMGAFNTRQRASRITDKAGEQVFVRYVEQGEFEPYPRKYPPGAPMFSGPPTVFSPEFFSQRSPREGDRVRALTEFILKDKDRAWARTLGNRTWAWLIGRGVVEPVDEFDLKHKQISPDLMAALTGLVEEGKGSLKSLVRTICSTETYQRSSESAGKCDLRHFCRGTVLPLTGEQMLNSIQVALRGAPGLDVQEAQELTAALTMRPQVGCEVQPLPCGTLHALMFRNSERIWEWIRGSPVLTELRKTSSTDEEAVDRMFLSALSRRPTSTERTRFTTFLRDRGSLGFEDGYWSLMNTAEFLTRH